MKNKKFPAPPRSKRTLFWVLITAGALALLAGAIFFLLSMWTEETLITDPTRYADAMAEADFQNPFHTAQSPWIFPETLPENTKVNDFVYHYYNPWDANYVIYLDLTFSEEDWQSEVERLEKEGISNKLYGTYGTTGFPARLLCGRGNNSGILYAMTDEKEHRIYYVEIAFHNSYCDIDYREHIPAEILPIGFDALQKAS